MHFSTSSKRQLHPLSASFYPKLLSQGVDNWALESEIGVW